MEVQAIIDAIKENPTLVGGILPTIQESEAFKTVLNNKADVIFEEKIGERTKEIHTQYDDNMFDILGVRPEVVDGKKQKTYEKIKELFTDYKGLLAKKDSLTKDAELIALQGQIETLKKEGGGKHIQEIFDGAKTAWESKENEYKTTIQGLQGETVDFQKRSQINEAVKGLKLDPNIPESIRKMAITNAENELMKNSEIKDGKLIFLNAEGKPAINQTTYEPMSASDMLADVAAIKDISLKDVDHKGGGADPKINGSIKTIKVEGKDVQKLNIAAGSYKTRLEFIQVAEKAMIDAGITKRDKRWDELKNDAYKELKIADLPRA